MGAARVEEDPHGEAKSVVRQRGRGGCGIGMGGIATANGRDARFHVMIKGANESPHADPDGRGDARPGKDRQHAQVCLPALRPLRHAQPGPHPPGRRRQDGPIVVALFDLSTADGAPHRCTTSSSGTDRRTCAPSPATAPLKAIVDHPERFYVNLHNAGYPGRLDPRPARRSLIP